MTSADTDRGFRHSSHGAEPNGAGPDVAEADLSEQRPQRRRAAVAKRLVGQAAFVLGVLATWQLASGRVVDEFWVSEPTSVANSLQQLLAGRDGGGLLSSDLAYHTAYTIQSMLLGLAIGLLSGCTLGFILGRVTALAEVFNPFIVAVYSIPKLALAPLFILWFGIGFTTKVAFAALIVFFLVFFNTYSGTREVDRDLVDTARLMGGGSWTVMRKIVIPSALVWVFAGMRLSVPYALVGAVTAEMLASNRGLGFLLINASRQFDTAGVFAALSALLILALAVNGAVKLLERYLLRWKLAGGDVGTYL